MEKTIQYFGQPAKVACDEQCNKAWGHGRPKFYLELGQERIFGYGYDFYFPSQDESLPELQDEDDWAYLSDGELGQAPVDPGTREGMDRKPTRKEDLGNRWCVRACERCVMSKPGEYNLPLELKDFSKRRYNYHSKNT